MNLPVYYNKISPSTRKIVREEYTRRQNGLCSHCGSPLTGKPAAYVAKNSINKSLFPKGFFNWPVHLHHSHDTGMTLGAVHNYCNAVLWQYHSE